MQLTDSLTLPLKLVLDTGASHALSLELDSDPRLVGPAQRLPTDLGQGLGGTVKGYLGRVAALQLGRVRLRAAVGRVADEYLVGPVGAEMDALERCRAGARMAAA